MKKIIPVMFCGMALAAVVLMPGIALAEEGSEPSSNQAAAAENQRQTADQQSKEKDDNTVVDTAAAPTQKSEVPVTEVEVKDKKDQKTTAKEGGMAVGYKVENTATTGPWGNMKLQDTPYSINVIPQELIENVQASAPDQLFRMNPVTQLYMPQALNGRPTFNMRGFYSATSAEDGMSNYNGWGIYLEDVDRVEILTGLSGFLYGPGNVGGLVNYIPKRPTAEQIANVTIGNYGGGSNYLHGDFGGPVGKDNKLAYRLNVLAQDGDTAIENQTLNRKMVSGALDWHIASNLLVQFNASHQDYKANGLPTSWGTASGVAYPSAPDAEKLWSQKWTFQKLEADRAGINLKWDISDVFTLRTAYRSAEYNDQTGSLAGTIQNNGTYTEGFSVRAPRTLQTTGSQAFLDAHFNTGLIEHKVTMGFYGNTAKWKLHQDSQYSTNLSGSFSFADPVYVTMPSYAAIGTKPWYTSYDGANKNYMFGDSIKFNDSWSALVGLNHGTIIAKNYNTAGVQTSKYDMSATTPSVSLVYKPVPAVMTYATYMESLEQGQIVTGTQYTNN
ncbi:MAG TPA: TonB-dependent receptor, partial [Negativicutes bacterium]